MEKEYKKIELQTKSGEEVTVGEIRVTPQSQSLTVRWPQGGWVWNRPSRLVVQRGEETEHIPVLDVTRILQVVLYSLSALGVVIGFFLAISQKEKLT